jgi:hypothetical protein
MRNEDGTGWWTDASIYWAHGVLAERLGMTVTEADQALRAHVEKTGRSLLEVADDVVGFRLLFDPGDDR